MLPETDPSDTKALIEEARRYVKVHDTTHPISSALVYRLLGVLEASEAEKEAFLGVIGETQSELDTARRELRESRESHDMSNASCLESIALLRSQLQQTQARLEEAVKVLDGIARSNFESVPEAALRLAGKSLVREAQQALASLQDNRGKL